MGTYGDDQDPDQAADQDIGHAGLEAGARVTTGQAADAGAIPVGQLGATEPCSWRDKIVKVITPATEVTNVEARAAGATSAGFRPDPIKIGAGIGPPPIP